MIYHYSYLYYPYYYNCYNCGHRLNGWDNYCPNCGLSYCYDWQYRYPKYNITISTIIPTISKKKSKEDW